METFPIRLVATLLVSVPALSAATHAVLPGGAIQPIVDSAQSGDIVAIFGGTYPDDITINKPIRLVEADGHEVTLTGNVTFSGVVNAPVFEGFTVGSSGKGITVNNTNGITIKNTISTSGFGLKVIGASKAAVIGGNYSEIDQTDGILTVSQASVAGRFMTGIGSQKTSAYRVSAGSWNWSSVRGVISYSSGGRLVHSGSNSVLKMVGSTFDANGVDYITVDIHGDNNDVEVFNCTIKGSIWGYGHYPGPQWISYSGQALWIRGGATKAKIINNYIQITPVITNEANYDYSLGDGIDVASANSVILNNIISGANYAISAPFGAKVSNNLMHGIYRGASRGGVVPEAGLTGDPLFIANQYPEFNSGSPCINAGVEDPLYNDLDGTRNNIGPRGGCLFDPEGWTTDKPVVISFDLGPTELLKGVDTQVTLSNGQAVGQK